jgi:endonuclease/exonuclease/phosphatase family metal-dependent hydrolase
LVLSSIFISPEVIWLSGLIAMMIPLVLLINSALLVYLIFKRSGLLLYPLFICIVGLLFLNRTISVHQPGTANQGISVLSYNVRVFNVYNHLNTDFIQSKNAIDWVRNRNDDIMCFQEFYVQPGHEIFSTIEAITKQNPYSHFESSFKNSIGGQFGMAIFSKYPMIQKGSLQLSDGRHSVNNLLFADIVVGQDTLRIYNIHLESMGIDENRLANSNSENISRNLRQLLSQLKNGFVQRAAQVDNLCKHLERSPYPIILAGDLTDMPYSYSYQKLKKYLHSSFENGGSGFGFTFNGLLFFLRIDNQFYSEGVNLGTFATLREVKHTDHFPISAIYSLE